MRRACEWVCYMKTAHPRPESFIPDALRKGEKATTPEPDDSVAPAYGTGIDWNEFHMYCFNVCWAGSAVFFRSVG